MSWNTGCVRGFFPGLPGAACEKYSPGKSWSGVLLPWGSQEGKGLLPEGQIPKVCTKLNASSFAWPSLPHRRTRGFISTPDKPRISHLHPSNVASSKEVWWGHNIGVLTTTIERRIVFGLKLIWGHRLFLALYESISGCCHWQIQSGHSRKEGQDVLRWKSWSAPD